MSIYDPRTALLVVDVQNDFADPAGSLSVGGGVDVVPLVNEQVRQAAAAGALVAYTQDWHPESTPHFAKDGGIWPVHCVAGSWGAELHPSLIVLGQTVRKGTNGEDGYSAFSMRDPISGEEMPTEMDAHLRRQGVERVVVCGLATDYCVRATVMDALRLGYRALVLTDAVAAVNLQPGDGAQCLADMAAAGARLVTTGALRSGGSS